MFNNFSIKYYKYITPRIIISLLCVFTIISFSSLAYAQNNKFDHNTCTELSKLAGMVMKHRQANVPIHEQIELLQDTGDEAWQNFVEVLIINAYDVPRYQTESVQQNAINDYQNKIYMSCIKRGK